MDYNQMAKDVKESSFILGATSVVTRNTALEAIRSALDDARDRIFQANQLDLEKAEAEKLAPPLYNRLKFDSHKLDDVLKGIADLISMPDPLNQVLLKRQLDEGLVLVKETCPIGIIGVIFESRPDALVQISALCIKSGNCAILKGGSEALHTNRVLFDIIKKAGHEAGLPEGFISLVEDREGVEELLKCDKYIDLIIPRGSNAFVRYIQEHSRIPVMGHSDGICHIYVDEKASVQKALNIVTDSKTQYVAACNTVETLLVHKAIAGTFLPLLADALKGKVAIRGCTETRKIIPCDPATEEDFKTEYLDYIISAKIVDNIDEAIRHINTYGSHHTDSIITEDSEAAVKFMSLVDSAGVYQNCSTRFADGFRYGFGAEVGISTGKLHARGPVGLDGLVTYKYKLYGNGHVVSDYAEGRKTFKFKNL